MLHYIMWLKCVLNSYCSMFIQVSRLYALPRVISFAQSTEMGFDKDVNLIRIWQL